MRSEYRVAPEGFPELARGVGKSVKFAAVFRLHSGTLCCWYAATRREASKGRAWLSQNTGLIIVETVGVFPVVEVQ
jgi:hypothetical protein